MRQSIDRTFAALTVLTAVIGVLIFFSASLALLTKGGGSFGSALFSQLIFGLGGGLAAAYALTKIPMSVYRKYAPHLFVLGLVLTGLVFVPFLGVTANGATRWINLGFTTFQPSEFLKIGYVLMLAAVLSQGRDRGADYRRGVLPFIVCSGLVAVLLLLQPDTDTMLIIIASGGAMLFAAGLKWRDLAIGFLVVCIGLGVLVAVRPYLMDRVQTYLNPSSDQQGTSYQITQSLIAVGSGGLWGRGYGQSIQKFSYLPEASSDAVFAVFAEEFGFWGSVSLVFLYLSFVLRGLWVSARAHDLFGGLVALGLVVCIGGQVFANIAAMIGLIPVGGLPLPFVSHGGTALFMVLAMSGIVLAVSKTVRE